MKIRLSLLFLFLICMVAQSQSYHTLNFSGSSSDFYTTEKYSAAANGTDYYITFDATYIYIGAFRTSGTFAGTDNLAIYIDTDPNSTPGSGTGTTSGQSYNGVSGSLPFSANYNVHAEQSYQEARSYATNWAGTISGLSYITNTTAREVKIPFTSIGSPNSLYLTMWIGNAGGFYSNAPGTNLSSTANPSITGYFGGFGVSSTGCTPVSIINTAITDLLSNGNPVSGLSYGKVNITSGSYTASGNFTIAPGGSLNQSGGTLTLGSNTLTMASGTTINSTAGTLNAAGSTIYFSGKGKISGSSSLSLNNLTIDGSAGDLIVLSTALSVGGQLALNNGTLTVGSTLTLNGNSPTRVNGTIDASNPGAIVAIGNAGTTTIPASLFSGNVNTLSVIGTGTTVAGDNLNCVTLNNTTGATLDMGNYTISTLSDQSPSGPGEDIGTSPSPTINNSSSTIKFNAANNGIVISSGTVVYSCSTGGQTIAAGTYSGLTLSNSSGTNTAGGDIALSGTLSTTAGGTFDLGTNLLSSVNAVAGHGIIETQNTNSTPVPSAKTWSGMLVYNGTSQQTAVAGTFEKLLIDNPVDVSLNDSVLVNSLLTINSGKSLTINTGGKLDAFRIINNAGVSGLTVNSAPNSVNGSLIFHNPSDSTVAATVAMYSKAAASTFTNGKYSNYKWQFFGIPIQSVDANPTFQGSYVRKQEETGTSSSSLWVNQTNSSVLIPFAGYEITQALPTTIYFQGSLLNTDYSATLSYTSAAMYPGQHLLANPYTAAIDITKLNFGTQMDSCVYLYNTGSYNDWASYSGSGSGDNPGQYKVAPQKVAGTAGIPGQIPSMQGFLVAAKSSSSDATISIPYSSVITRNKLAQKLKSVTDSVNSPMIFTRIDIAGTRFNDVMWLFTDPTTSHSYNNGWDGYKFLGSSLAPQLWAMENDGDYQVDAVDDINDTNLGFITGEDTNYSLTFTHGNLNLKYPALYLLDLVDPNNPVVTDITQSGTKYSFSAVQSSSAVSRFKIVSNPGVATSLQHSSGNNLNIYCTEKSVFYIQNNSGSDGNVEISEISTKPLMKKQFKANGITAIPYNLPAGTYIAKLVTPGSTVVKKLVLK
ncbi:MAG: T9SS type A sorting domain-containing protein [Paludibacter sp.]